jgi:tetratricopeptide (TPR) repeat protein
MMKQLLNTLLCAATLIVGSFASNTVVAQTTDASTRESPQAVWRNEGNFKAVQKTWELVANEQYQEAIVEFGLLVEKIKDPYERSQAMFGMAQAQMATDQFAPALKLYEQIVEMDVLPNKPHFDAMFQIGQLYYMRERYDDALRWVGRWMEESGEVKVEAYELKASIFAQKEDHRQAIENIDQAISLSDKPKETWYQLKLAMHYELKEYANCGEVLGVLVRGWPAKKQYWTQLSSINVTLKRDADALAVMALAHRQGLLDKETDYIQLFSLYGYMEVPLKAAKVLEEGIEKGIVEPTKKHYESLGNAWYASRELDKAVVALSKAGEKSLDGKIHMQVAYILVDKEDWDAAKVELNAALQKGGLKDTQVGNLLVLLGMSELNTGNSTAARKAFQDARQYPKVRASAQQWLNHLDELKKRGAQAAP